MSMRTVSLSSSPVSSGEEIDALLADAECTQVDANRQAALQGERMLRVVQYARRHPELYVPAPVDVEAVRFAERAAVLDLAVRMNQTEDHVRGLVHVTEQAVAYLPRLWERARTGFASLYVVGRAVNALGQVTAPADATEEELALQAAAFAAIDASCAVWSETASPVSFNRRLKTLVNRLHPVPAAKRHANAMRDRRVYVEDVEDGMAWFHALMPAHEAQAAFRRATATAKHLSKDAREGRTRDQIRADLASAWLRGIGTATAVKTKVFVTIPVQLLSGKPLDPAALDPAALDPATLAALTAEQARVVGGDRIDPVTAAQLFFDAAAFHRVVNDPVTGVVLDMDRRTYRPTRTQRDWLILKHGTCARDGCERLAADADIDHRTPWAAGGATNEANLAPLCPRCHTHNHRTSTRYRSRPDGTIQITTPTGHTTHPDNNTPAPF